MQATWEKCRETAAASLINPDHGKANSLRRTANARVNFLSRIAVDAENVNFIFEGMYASVVELLHAHLSMRGFTVANHVCLGYYLRDVLQRSDLFRLFDDCRYNRNALVYYGREMDFKTAQESMEKAKKLIEAIGAL